MSETGNELRHALTQIEHYAVENGLSPEQVKACFEVGLAARKLLSACPVAQPPRDGTPA